MIAENRRSWWFVLALAPLAGLVLASSSGCTLHRNLLLRWHLEFDADTVCDDEIPPSADDCCRCDKCSKLGRTVREVGPGPTPAQMGHARFHPVPSKPVFPEPDGSDMADMGPPAPEWYMRRHEPLKEPGRIESEKSIPAPDLEEVEPPTPPMSNSG
jgi:hypothetical protein